MRIQEDAGPSSADAFWGASPQTLPGIGEKRAELFHQAGIKCLGDLLFYFPRDYSDRTTLNCIKDATLGRTLTFVGEAVHTRTVRLRRNLVLVETLFRDTTGEIRAIWFGRPFLQQVFRPNTRALLTGNITERKGLVLSNPEYELLSEEDEKDEDLGRIVPIYRLSGGLTQRLLRRTIALALDKLPNPIPETLPDDLRLKHGYPCIREALFDVHFPATLQKAKTARDRFAYEELLAIQLGILMSRRERIEQEKGICHTVNGPLLTQFRKKLPFALTTAQQRAVKDLLTDMTSPRPMARLLHGDVGCGKTIVAIHAVLAAVDGGYQTAVMAPTEILAEQHYYTLQRYLKPLGVPVALLTGSVSNPALLRQEMREGKYPVVVGTHALVQETTEFSRLGLVVVDEQHRFGVVQREKLVSKGYRPDVLHMTATPIPRTLALTVYGGMDITVVDEMPPGRSPVKTIHVQKKDLPRLYEFVKKEIAQGFQAYYVCPLIEESQNRNSAALTKHYREMSQGVFAGLRTAMIHGRMTRQEKEMLMEQFRRRELDILFSTSVVEVGIDCPNATIMIIEDAPHFGLSQLHQLRGRVGRSNRPSYCFLLGTPRTSEGKKRIDVMCKTSNGFEIAEEDLKLRGPGEFTGVRQTGLSDLQIADLIRDTRLLESARKDAEAILMSSRAEIMSKFLTLWEKAERFRRLSL
ncbi:MAG TPA: ATP-dependent DNA helicase RecG [Candidatus Hydrogenedentes bacterium]|nr:ATP-dependent DNA helicase RecG [Candidatus Hydrogenedentota bacterium]HOL77370.1 ATP-dependent DNA helicase RecG [Candidatus Hydrogenedentota bacterium]HPO84812.1 ATP-dependent DNA helicase RecG [Candidatus Hydrogenedentota bacterium]